VQLERTSNSSSSTAPPTLSCSIVSRCGIAIAALLRGLLRRAAISSWKDEAGSDGASTVARWRSRWPMMMSASLGASSAPNLTCASVSRFTCIQQCARNAARALASFPCIRCLEGAGEVRNEQCC
jgi:hypothetical protein